MNPHLSPSSPSPTSTTIILEHMPMDNEEQEKFNSDLILWCKSRKPKVRVVEIVPEDLQNFASGGVESSGPTTQKKCGQCGCDFLALNRELRRGKGIFCSLVCANQAKADKKRNPNWRAEWYEKKKNDPFFLKQRRARHLVESAIIRGELKRQPCEACGKLPSEAHHDDYDKPLQVRWLCRSHHMKHDRNRPGPLAETLNGGSYENRSGKPGLIIGKEETNLPNGNDTLPSSIPPHNKGWTDRNPHAVCLAPLGLVPRRFINKTTIVV